MQLQQCFKIPVQRYVTYHFENALKTMKAMYLSNYYIMNEDEILYGYISSYQSRIHSNMKFINTS